MSMRLYAHPLSGASQRAAVVLHEKKVPFKLIFVDLLEGAHKTPEYLAKHPFGQVPCLDDDGFLVYESRAIGRYIATKYADQGPELIPTTLKGKALLEQAISMETSNFDPFIFQAVYERVYKKIKDMDTDEALVKKLFATLDTKLDAYDKILSNQKYVAGDDVTLADLFHLPYGAYLYTLGEGDLIDKRPHVKRWWYEISSRPSWQAIKDGIKGFEVSN